MCYCSVWLTCGTAANWEENRIRLCQVNWRNVLCLLKCILFSPFQLNSTTAVHMLLAVLYMCSAFTSVKWSYLGGAAFRNADLLLKTEPLQGTSKWLPWRWETKTAINPSGNSGQSIALSNERETANLKVLICLPYVLWVYKIVSLALIKLSWLQHSWLSTICGIHLRTLWRGVGVFTKGLTYYQQWQLHRKLSIIRSRFSVAFNFLIFSWFFYAWSLILGVGRSKYFCY